MKTQNAAQTLAETGIRRSRVCALHDFLPDQTYSIFKMRGLSRERKMRNELDEPRPPASTDNRRTGSCKQLSHSTVEYNALAWLVQRPLRVDYLDCGADTMLHVSN